MDVVRPEFVPDPALDRAEMVARQREVARAAAFCDAFPFDAGAVRTEEPVALESEEQAPLPEGADAPVVVGVDQAFREERGRAVSAAVAVSDGRVVERATGSAPLEMPYVPGLLSFREGGAILDALGALTVSPDLLVLDGSGRIHFRQAGIATHVGVLLDCPAVGVAKNLLCGTPRASLAEPLPAGARVAVEADDDVERLGADDPDWPVLGAAVQSRQYDDPERRHVNPLYVSPGHRVCATTAVDLVERLCAGYKLPEPTRLADAAADEIP